MTNLNASTTLATTPVPALPPKPKRRKRKIIVIGPNGGGVRKTKTALVFGSVAAAAGCTVIYVCGDRGIGSLSASLKEGGPNRVELLPDEESGNYAETLLAIAEEADADVIIIDLGANEMLNSKSRRTVRAALRQLKVLGHDTFVVLSLVPGKVGLEDDAANFARQMSKDAEVLLAFHSRDEGSDLTKFGELKGDYPTVDVATDQLAILELITAAGVTPFDWCSAHPAGFATAAAWIARNLLQLAQQPIMADIVYGDRAVPVLAPLAKNRPQRFYTGRNAKWQVRDEVLAADSTEIAAEHALKRLTSNSDDAVILAAARSLIDASHAREAVYRAARIQQD